MTHPSAGSSRPLALLSVTDKSGLVPFARGLVDRGFDLLSTGGTARLLTSEDIPVTDVAQYTGQPEIMDGRVKTLHPKIHGGILFDRANPAHVAEAERQGMRPLDLVVVNLYEFEKSAVKAALSLEKAIEFVDIGGPTMLRAAAKNWQHTLPVIDPADYPKVLAALDGQGLDRTFRSRLAAKVFATISAYDGQIAAYFSKAEGGDSAHGDDLPQTLRGPWERQDALRYGENPHQRGAFYAAPPSADGPTGFASVEVLQGKALSYNNLLDLDAACAVVRDFHGERAASVIKHTNPCGSAASRDLPLAEVVRRAIDADSQSAFGGIIAVNEEVDAETAKVMTGLFTECIAAPSVSPEAREIFSAKKNLRVVIAPFTTADGWSSGLAVRSIAGGLLVQDEDPGVPGPGEWRTVTTKTPDQDMMVDLEFAMKIVRHVKSNAIVFAKDGVTLAVGAGQMSRVDAAKFAAEKAKSFSRSLQGAVLASDAFFPFRDTVDFAAELGIKGIIQPGGSMRDDESIAAADEAGITMVFTGRRHFRH